MNKVQVVVLIFAVSSSAYASYDWQAQQAEERRQTWQMIEDQNRQEQAAAQLEASHRDAQNQIFEQQQFRYQQEDEERARELQRQENRLRGQ